MVVERTYDQIQISMEVDNAEETTQVDIVDVNVTEKIENEDVHAKAGT